MTDIVCISVCHFAHSGSGTVDTLSRCFVVLRNKVNYFIIHFHNLNMNSVLTSVVKKHENGCSNKSCLLKYNSESLVPRFPCDYNKTHL